MAAPVARHGGSSRRSPGAGSPDRAAAATRPGCRRYQSDRLFEAGLECLLRAPSELPFELGRVDGVASVVTRPVGDEGDQAAA